MGREGGREGGKERRRRRRKEGEARKGGENERMEESSSWYPLIITSPLPTPIGPFRYLDSYGAQKLLSTINRFRETYGDHFEPAPLLQDFAKDPSRKFHPK